MTQKIPNRKGAAGLSRVERNKNQIHKYSHVEYGKFEENLCIQCRVTPTNQKNNVCVMCEMGIPLRQRQKLDEELQKVVKVDKDPWTSKD